MSKKPQYKVIDIGNTSEPKKARIEKIQDQIPKGKAMIITDSTFNQPSNKALVQIIDPRDIPPIHRPHNRTKAILIKAGFRNVTKTSNPKTKTQKNK